MGRDERAGFDASRRTPAATAAWLLGRLVAKDAARICLRSELCMADVAIHTDENGRPILDPSSAGRVNLSLSHTGFEAIAVAVPAGECAGVGIDLEPVRSLERDLVEEAFDSGERSRIERAANEAGESLSLWQLSAWCAKEAMGKALGLGVLGGPRCIRLAEIDVSERSFSGRPVGELHRRWRESSDRAETDLLTAYARTYEDHVVTLCIAGGREPSG